MFGSRDDRIRKLLAIAGLSPPAQIPKLKRPASRHSHAASSGDIEEARSLLVQQRTADPGYKPPERQFRNKFRSRKRREENANPLNWVFTKHEVAQAFDVMLSVRPLADSGVAQALLLQAPETSVDRLWAQLYGAKPESTLKNRFKKSRDSLSQELPGMTWLDDAVREEDLEYIQLISDAGIDQETLQQAFSVALMNRSLITMKLLLSYDIALTLAHKSVLRELVKAGVFDIVGLLLSVPNAMGMEDWRYGLKSQSENFAIVLLMSLAHQPGVACGSLLLHCLRLADVEATASVLAYADPGEDFSDVRQSAYSLLLLVHDEGTRFEFCRLFHEAGLLLDAPELRSLLLEAAKSHNLPLTRILMTAGVSFDIEPFNALHWTVKRMDLDVLKLFWGRHFASPVSPVLSLVPDSASELDLLQLLHVLAPHGLSGEPLHSHLVRAVDKQHSRLVGTLLILGASLEFDRAAAVRAALEQANFDVLGMLLRKDCSPDILSAAIPAAMALGPGAQRLQAMRCLMEKGVSTQALGLPLQTVVFEAGAVDYDLVSVLLKHKAPIDGIGEHDNNGVLMATRRGDLHLLNLLCDAAPLARTLSEAVPLAFDGLHFHGKETVLEMITTLLNRGATGVPVNETLLDAIFHAQRLDIVRLLLTHGADANYMGGVSFLAALDNLELLGILCGSCPPNEAVAKAVLSTALLPQHYNLEALELLLASTASFTDALNSLQIWHCVKNNPNLEPIVLCFLRHGLDVNLKGRNKLSFVVQKQNMILLRALLLVNPTTPTLRTAFEAAISISDRATMLEAMKLLLWQAKSAEIGQSSALMQQTLLAINGDSASLELCLKHGAKVDIDGGMVIQTAAAAGSPKVLEMLCLNEPAPMSLRRACLAAASSVTNEDQKQRMYKHLLAANSGALTQDISSLLADSVLAFPNYLELPKLLISRGAKVRVATLKKALVASSRELFGMLATKVKSSTTVAALFRHARATTMDPDRKYWAYQYLLAKGVPPEEISKALVASMRTTLTDLSCQKLLLRHGAAVGYKRGLAFLLGLRANSREAVKLLIQFIDDDQTANIAFSHARKTPLEDPKARYEVYGSLLQWNISHASMFNCLVAVLQESHSNVSVIETLLEKGVDPNKHKAKCFVLAARTGAEPAFRALSKYAKLAVVLRALQHHFEAEKDVLRWSQICLHEQPFTTRIDDDELVLCTGWKKEQCTALVWALFSSPKVGNDNILVLLDQGAEALPWYNTPKTQVSAAFGCLLDKSRTSILMRLLTMSRSRTMSYEIPITSFNHLGAFLTTSAPDESFLGASGTLDLRLASLYFGSADAFCVLNIGHPEDDGSLHLAALLALPKVVDRLLRTHDPNVKEEEFDNRIPLAVVSDAQPQPWCKIANEEADFRTRQKQTMQLLAAKTKPVWRFRGKTVLHFALDNGVPTAQAMIEALDIRHDSRRQEKYRYTDKGGKQYTPHEWIIEFLEAGDEEKVELVKCLQVDGGWMAPLLSFPGRFMPSFEGL
ncbi:uncharacterized protein LTR77_000426 [Saxophila tyrrhenica]|uniref:Uncharacterized protein n=1 Tax=Saxophila tyrrhenica TaxID=1690608 RepID=A0AAV9PSE5_9PEZI|nr:hypothetical protein LTR77_000426 [Saxophila tyrrhenica]